MKLRNTLSVAILLIGGGLAQAQDRTYLNKGEVEQLLVGKVSTHLRFADSNKVKWDVKSSGVLYGNNITVSGSDTARWELKDDGGLCVKWRGKSQDGCFYHFKSGDKIMRTESSQATAPVNSEILEIQ